MAFPTSPTNGQTATVNGVVYTYNSTLTAWTVGTEPGGNVSGNALNITGSASIGTTLSAVGNVTGNYILGNGALLTGVITSVANINLDTSNVTVVSSNGNITMGVGGTSNVVVVATTGAYATGLLSATGNITGNNVSITTSLGVGTTPSGTAGEIRATNAITAFYSDRRLKTEVARVTNALDKVDMMIGVIYTQNKLAETYGYNNYDHQVGVYAQDVENAQPEAVKPAPFDIAPDGTSKSGQNYLTVQYEKLIPLLIEAVKELRVELNALKEK
jgi:hypothetical protein